MEIREISRMMIERVESIVQFLFPAGRREGHEWVIGSVKGEQGKSCKIRLSGEKAGLWSDFATGDKGDLIDLWRLSRGVQLKDALVEIKTYLNISEQKREQAGRVFKKPVLPKTATEINSKPLEYLEGRGLKPESLKSYRVMESGGHILFPYYRDGELIFHKHLAIERDEKGKKKTWVSRDAEPCLFGWQAIDPNSREVTICEGEIDAVTLYQYGYPALSVPFGGGIGHKHDWIETEWENLEQFGIIYLCMDMDNEGQKAAREIANRLGLHRCKIVELPQKDANECLMQGVSPVNIHSAFTCAQTIDPDELKRAGVFTKAVVEKFYPPGGKQPGYDLPWEKTHGRIRILPGEVSVWSGYNGSGKSLFLGQVVVEGALSSGFKSCIASFEMSADKTLHRMVLQQLGPGPPIEYIQKEMDKLNEGVWIFDLVGTGKIDRMMDVFQYAYRRYGITQFIVDSLSKLGMAEDDYAGQKALVERFGDFVRVTGSHIHLVAHARKGKDELSPPRKMDIKGTGAITDMVDNVYIVHRNKAKYIKIAEAKRQERDFTDLLTEPDTFLICDKSRENGAEAERTYSLYFDRRFQHFTEAQKW